MSCLEQKPSPNSQCEECSGMACGRQLPNASSAHTAAVATASSPGSDGAANDTARLLHSCSFNHGVLDGQLSWLDYASVRDNIVSSPRYADILALSDRPDTTLFGDAPYLFLYREMDRRHPGSKFVLSLRKGGLQS